MFEKTIIFLKNVNLLSAVSLRAPYTTHPPKKSHDQQISKSKKIVTEGQSAKIRPVFSISMSAFLIILMFYSIPITSCVQFSLLDTMSLTFKLGRTKFHYKKYGLSYQRKTHNLSIKVLYSRYFWSLKFVFQNKYMTCVCVVNFIFS